MKLPGYPVTRQGWDTLVKRESWPFTEVKSKGRGGVRREYKPPAHILELIRIRQAARDTEEGVQNLVGLGRSLERFLERQPEPLVVRHAAGAGKTGATVQAIQEQLVSQQAEDDNLEIKLPKIGGAAEKCPDCGAFIGLLKLSGRVRLEFDIPDPLVFMQVMASMTEGITQENYEQAFALAIRAFSILSLITAGNRSAIESYLDNPKLVELLKALSLELNAQPAHHHSTPAE